MCSQFAAVATARGEGTLARASLSSIIKVMRVRALRAVIVAASMLAWFAAADHCLWAAPPCSEPVAAATEGGMTGCPMHATHQQQPRQQKRGDCAQLICCKRLTANSVAFAQLVRVPVFAGLLPAFREPAATASRLRLGGIFSDTGPPGETSFVELVLQRSILAHAPPVSLA